MLGRNKNLVIGLTTFHNELLRVSVTALGRLKQHFLLVIYNDNPTTTLTRGMVRRLGYRGPLHIINGTDNIGTIRARFCIVDFVRKMRVIPEWLVFMNDNDILTNATIPNVGPDIFAVVQNSLSLRHRVVDLIAAIQCPAAVVPDGDNIVLASPHIGICGVFIRTRMMMALADALTPVMDEVERIDSALEYRPPYDIMMWNWLNDFVRAQDSRLIPIYMDSVNYITTDIDSPATKYGRAVIYSRDLIKNAIADFDMALAAALRGENDDEKTK